MYLLLTVDVNISTLLISGTLGKILLSFSVYTNITKLLNTNQPAGTLSSINGIRFLSMTWVLLGHSYALGTSTAGKYSNIKHKDCRRTTGSQIGLDMYKRLE